MARKSINPRIKLSKNFWLHEYTYSDEAKREVPVDLKDETFYLVKKHAENIMQPIRNFVGSEVSILSGIRDYIIWGVLNKNRRRPSKTTDHSFGNDVYYYGSGAADFYCPKKNKKFLIQVFKWVKNECNYGCFDVGQCILYLTKKGIPRFIHVSNPKSIVYSTSFVESFIKPKKGKFLYNVAGKWKRA